MDLDCAAPIGVILDDVRGVNVPIPHVIGFAAYKCDYCGTKFYTSQEAEAHLRQSQICQRKNSYSIVSDAAIYDTIYYENLMPNKTYEVVGHLIDVRTGKAVKINQKQVQSDRKSFTPEAPNGEVGGKKGKEKKINAKNIFQNTKNLPHPPRNTSQNAKNTCPTAKNQIFGTP